MRESIPGLLFYGCLGILEIFYFQIPGNECDAIPGDENT